MSLCLENQNLCPLFPAMWNRYEQLSPVWHEQTGPRARRGRIMCKPVVLIRILLLEDIDEALASDHVDPAPVRIVKHVVGIADDFDGRGLVARLGIDHQHASGRTAANQQSMMGFVESHRVV